MDVKDYRALVSKVTKVPDASKTVWAKNSKLCMMYIEFRNMEIIRDNLNNVCNVYGGGDTALTIVYSGDNEKIVHETTRGWTNVTYMKMYEQNVPVEEYSRLLSSYEFWDKFSAFEHVLTNSWDSYIFRRIPEKFFEYDIVGGPCKHFYTEYHDRIVNICGEGCTCPRCENGDHIFKEQNFIRNPNNFFMFNGGFYLRKIDSVKALCKIKTWNGEPDDVYFALSGLSRPSRSEAREFGVQDFKYDSVPVGCHQIWIKHEEYYVRNLFREVKFGKIVGRFFLKKDLGLYDDDTPDLITISELVETYPLWPTWIKELPEKRKQLFTMFETSDVHPDVIENMKLFDKVIVPYDYLKDILRKYGVNCEALNWYTSPLIQAKPRVIKKSEQKNKKVFLYIGTNDVRKNLVKLCKTFKEVIEGTDHRLIVKTNKVDNLPESKNIKYITNRMSHDEMAGLYNICDYVVSFTHGEGVGLPMLEAKYFGKPVISHDGGVLSTLKDDSWIVLPSEETAIDHTNVPDFLQKVFHGTWWKVDTKEALRIINNLIHE
jgi:glycosyltransferase involved in cell wall biosynthesis